MNSLLIDDGADAEWLEPWARLLLLEGFSTWAKQSVSEGLAALDTQPFDLVVLRWSSEADAPCRRVRDLHPGLLLTLVDGNTAPIEQELSAFNSGADECLTLSSPEPVARVRVQALFRRVRIAAALAANNGGAGSEPRVCLHEKSRSIQVGERNVKVTAYEFALMRALAESVGCILSREELMERAKGSVDASFDRSIDVHMCRLRNKLGDGTRRQDIIRTIKGAGYMLLGPIANW